MFKKLVGGILLFVGLMSISSHAFKMGQADEPIAAATQDAYHRWALTDYHVGLCFFAVQENRVDLLRGELAYLHQHPFFSILLEKLLAYATDLQSSDVTDYLQGLVTLRS